MPFYFAFAIEIEFLRSIMSSDPIADMLTTIRNGSAAKKKIVVVPLSKIKTEVLKILKEHGFIEKFQVEEKTIKVYLRYYKNKSVVLNIKRISKPGVRIYAKAENVPMVLRGYGLTILSTSQGLMTDKEARKKSIGGELICQIY